jgi:release factor glutamine methyltransferase
MIGARVLSVPEPAPGMPVVTQPIVIHMDAAALPAARAALERAGWTCDDETATEVRLVRNSTGLILTSLELLEREKQAANSLRPRYAGLGARIRSTDVTLMGLKIHSEAGVAEPSVASELVIRKALRAIEECESPIVVEIATAAGGIALAIAAARNDATVLGIERSARGVRNARENAERNQLSNVQFIAGELLESVPGEHSGNIAAIVGTIPFEPSVMLMQRFAARNIPGGAKTAVQAFGAVGAKLVHELARQAHAALAPGGVLVLEIDEWQTNALANELNSLGFDAHVSGTQVVTARKRSEP